MLSRRTVIGAAVAGLLPAPAFAADADAALRRALDALPRAAPPAEQRRLLADFDPRTLSPGAAIDLDTVRAGLAVDAKLATVAPGSDAAYTLQLERRLGATVLPAAADRRLRAKAAQLHARADRLLRRLGLSHGPVGDRIVAFYRREDALYPDSDAGRDQAVADMNRWLDAARIRAIRDFPAAPSWCFDVSARRMTPPEEAARKGGYRTLPTRQSSGGYFVDLADIRRRPRWSLASVVQHELLPGHMIQLPIEVKAAPHKLRLDYLPAFAEGWAIAAEQEADRAGAFAGDPAAELGHVHWLLFRIARGVIDTGIHHGRWSDSEARRTLREIQGEPAYFASFTDEIDRVRREPASRTAEALAWLQISNLRERSPGRISPARFQALVLDRGRQRMDRLAKQLSG